MGSGRQPLTPALATALEQACAALEGPLPDTLGVCRGCCMSPRIEADFRNHAPRDLPDAYVEDWHFAAVADDFGPGPMRRVLPRTLAILAEGRDPAAAGAEVAAGRLRQAGYPDAFRAEERVALDAFFPALFEAWLARPEAAAWQLDDILCIVGRSGAPVTPCLARLDALPAADLVAVMRRDAAWRAGRLPFNAFWEDTPARQEVWDWLASPRLADRIFAHALDPRVPEGDRDAALALAETLVAAHDPPQG